MMSRLAVLALVKIPCAAGRFRFQYPLPLVFDIHALLGCEYLRLLSRGFGDQVGVG